MINRDKGTSDVVRQVVISPYAGWGGGGVGWVGAVSDGQRGWMFKDFEYLDRHIE